MFMWLCIMINSYNKTIFGIKLYVFQTAPLPIIRSFLLYTQRTCMTYTIAVCTVKISWWWTEEVSETCSFIPKISSEISASSWFYYKKVIRSHFEAGATEQVEDRKACLQSKALTSEPPSRRTKQLQAMITQKLTVVVGQLLGHTTLRPTCSNLDSHSSRNAEWCQQRT